MNGYHYIDNMAKMYSILEQVKNENEERWRDLTPDEVLKLAMVKSRGTVSPNLMKSIIESCDKNR